MVDVFSKALNNTIKIKRILGKIEGSHPGPTIVFFAGIHGNEPSGIFALKKVLAGINKTQVKGTIFAVSGNLLALKNQQRYINQDLNRLWTKKQIEEIKNKSKLNDDEQELIELLSLLNKVIKSNQPPFYFFDLHTTSSQTLPFITINDALINRKFSTQFPVPIILGIEEYLNGPLLSYINDLGYVSLGFESGQHDSKEAITNSIAFAYLVLVFSGALKKEAVINFSSFYEQLKLQSNNTIDVFEIVYLQRIQNNELFKMHDGFKSFDKIKKGASLAISDATEIKSPFNGRIFMPLYQKKGSEGFFIIKPIKPFLLKLSAILRNIKFDGALVIMPGISWVNKKEGILQVNLKVAKYFAKALFHLLGYRSKQVTTTHLKFYNRERVAKTSVYKKAPWY